MKKQEVLAMAEMHGINIADGSIPTAPLLRNKIFAHMSNLAEENANLT